VRCPGEQIRFIEKETRFLPFKGVDTIDDDVDMFRLCVSLSIGLVAIEEQVDPAYDSAWENTESTDERLLEIEETEW
jgi:hypothetical protein